MTMEFLYLPFQLIWFYGCFFFFFLLNVWFVPQFNLNFRLNGKQMCNEINNDVISNFNCNLISWCGAQWAMSDGVCVCARAHLCSHCLFYDLCRWWIKIRSKVSSRIDIMYGIDLEYGNKTRSMSQKIHTTFRVHLSAYITNLNIQQCLRSVGCVRLQCTVSTIICTTRLWLLWNCALWSRCLKDVS